MGWRLTELYGNCREMGEKEAASESLAGRN